MGCQRLRDTSCAPALSRRKRRKWLQHHPNIPCISRKFSPTSLLPMRRLKSCVGKYGNLSPLTKQLVLNSKRPRMLWSRPKGQCRPPDRKGLASNEMRVGESNPRRRPLCRCSATKLTTPGLEHGTWLPALCACVPNLSELAARARASHSLCLVRALAT